MKPYRIQPFLAVVLILATSACAHSPAGVRPSLGAMEELLFQSDPADVMLAVQSNAAIDSFELHWSVQSDRKKAPLTEEHLPMTNITPDEVLDIGLPAARENQKWHVWALDYDGQEVLRQAQANVRDAKARGEKLDFTAGWNFDGFEPMPVIYLTFAVMTSDGRWFTLMDNSAMIPEKKE